MGQRTMYREALGMNAAVFFPVCAPETSALVVVDALPRYKRELHAGVLYHYMACLPDRPGDVAFAAPTAADSLEGVTAAAAALRLVLRLCRSCIARLQVLHTKTPEIASWSTTRQHGKDNENHQQYEDNNALHKSRCAVRYRVQWESAARVGWRVLRLPRRGRDTAEGRVSFRLRCKVAHRHRAPLPTRKPLLVSPPQGSPTTRCGPGALARPPEVGVPPMSVHSLSRHPGAAAVAIAPAGDRDARGSAAAASVALPSPASFGTIPRSNHSVWVRAEAAWPRWTRPPHGGGHPQLEKPWGWTPWICVVAAVAENPQAGGGGKHLGCSCSSLHFHHGAARGARRTSRHYRSAPAGPANCAGVARERKGE